MPRTDIRMTLAQEVRVIGLHTARTPTAEKVAEHSPTTTTYLLNSRNKQENVALQAAYQAIVCGQQVRVHSWRGGKLLTGSLSSATDTALPM